MRISKREFDIRQPYFPEQVESDEFYWTVANELMNVIDSTSFGITMEEGLKKHLSLTLTGYFQDIVSDAGLWRSFVNANRKLYGWSVPFHKEGEDYIDYELNCEDVRFMVWYDVAMLDLERRQLYPHNAVLMEMADAIFRFLESRYDEAPICDEYNIARGLELNDPEDQPAIFHLANWLFNNSWLLTPAYALTLSEIASSPEVAMDKEGITLVKKLEDALTQDCTGPLALYIQEWVKLILEDKLPPQFDDKLPFESPAHPYYEKFVTATGGREIAYFTDYKSLNNFFITALGWEKNTEHLNHVKNDSDFVLMVNRTKGMLMARNVAKCIADPQNPLYDREYAREHSIDLLTVRGLCPADLFHYIYEHDWLSDACFPGSNDTELVKVNHDFIARCYLQLYYRGD